MNGLLLALRYFNPIGAHKSGLIGDDPLIKNSNLMPEIFKVVNGSKNYLNIFGDDYETLDGTGVRDYIHIMDLSEAHVTALDYVNKNTGINFFNIGTGKGVSVLELIKTFEKVSGLSVPIKISKEEKEIVRFALQILKKQMIYSSGNQTMIFMKCVIVLGNL